MSKFISCTVQELIEELQTHDPNTLVGFSYEYGDHLHSVAVGEITSFEYENVKWSENLRTHRVVKDSFDEDENVVEVLVLS